MLSLVWLAIPLLVLAVTAAAVTWVSRPRRRAEMHASVESFHRFRAALAADDGAAPSRRGERQPR